MLHARTPLKALQRKELIAIARLTGHKLSRKRLCGARRRGLRIRHTGAITPDLSGRPGRDLSVESHVAQAPVGGDLDRLFAVCSGLGGGRCQYAHCEDTEGEGAGGLQEHR